MTLSWRLYRDWRDGGVLYPRSSTAAEGLGTSGDCSIAPYRPRKLSPSVMPSELSNFAAILATGAAYQHVFPVHYTDTRSHLAKTDNLKGPNKPITLAPQNPVLRSPYNGYPHSEGSIFHRHPPPGQPRNNVCNFTTVSSLDFSHSTSS